MFKELAGSIAGIVYEIIRLIQQVALRTYIGVMTILVTSLYVAVHILGHVDGANSFISHTHTFK